MKTIIVSIFSAAMFFVTQNFADAKATAVSDIKDANILCYHISKSEALVFRSKEPQRVWKTLQDREGKIKTQKALQLGLSSMLLATDQREIHSFKANITEGYELAGSFEAADDGELTLTVMSTYIPDGGQSNIVDTYNCSKIKK